MENIKAFNECWAKLYPPYNSLYDPMAITFKKFITKYDLSVNYTVSEDKFCVINLRHLSIEIITISRNKNGELMIDGERIKRAEDLSQYLANKVTIIANELEMEESRKMKQRIKKMSKRMARMEESLAKILKILAPNEEDSDE